MNATLDCPVCGYRDVPGDTCPNCDTDLSSLRMLLTLPEIEDTPTQGSGKRNWSIMRIIGLTALISMAMGTLTGFAFGLSRGIPPGPLPPLPSPPPPLPEPTVTPLPPPPEPPDINRQILGHHRYVVKSGDTLNSIAFMFDISLDEIVVKNPQLQNREDEIYVGEEINILIAVTTITFEPNYSLD